MKYTIPTVLLVTLLLSWSVPASADFYMKTKVVGGMDTEIWTSGKKQRTQMNIPMIGETITIVRLDKGVEWTVDPKAKVYDEKPIAMTYTPEAPEDKQADKEEERNDAKSMFTPGQDVPQQDCDPAMHHLGEKRKYAGFEVEGYRAYCEGKEDQGMTFWIAPLKGDPDRIDKESREFAKEKTHALYANYPEKERKEMEEASDMLGDYLKMAFGHLKGDKVPKGLPLAMETPKSPDDPPGIFYEIKELHADKINPAVFDLPSGYTKVADVSAARAQAMMGEAGSPDFDPSKVEAMMKQMGVDPQDGGAGENNDEKSDAHPSR